MKLVLCVSAWFWSLLLGILIATQASDPDRAASYNHSSISSRSIQDIENPRLFPLQCGLPDAQKSLLCDPDHYLSNDEREFINNLLLPQKYGTEIIFVIIGSMDMSSIEDELRLTTADAAEWFSGQLFDRFFNFSNDSSIPYQHQALVFLSIHDRAIYFATGESLQISISSDYIQEIVDSMRPFLQQNQYFNAIETCLIALQNRISESTTTVVESETKVESDIINLTNANDTSEVKKNETVSISTDKSQDNNPLKTILEHDEDNSDGDDGDDHDDGDGDDANNIVFEYFQQQKANAGLLSNRMVLGGVFGAIGFLTVKNVLSLFRRTSSPVQRPKLSSTSGIQVTTSMAPIIPSKKLTHSPLNVSAIASTSSQNSRFSQRNARKNNDKTVLLLQRLVDSDATTDSLNSDETATISDHVWDSLLDPVDSHGFYRDESSRTQHPLAVDVDEVLLKQQASPLRTHSRWLAEHKQSCPPSRRMQHVRGQWTLARRMLHYVATPVHNEDTHTPGRDSRDSFRSPVKHSDLAWDKKKNNKQSICRTETKSSTFRTDGGVW